MLGENNTLSACNEAAGWVTLRRYSLQNESSLFANRKLTTYPYYRMLTASSNCLLGSCDQWFNYTSQPFYTNKVRFFHKTVPAFEGYKWALQEVAADKFLIGSEMALSWLNMNSKELSHFSQYNQYFELKTATILHIVPDKGGQLWICSNTGFY